MNFNTLNRVFYLFLLLLISGCGENFVTDYPDLGIMRVELDIDDEDLGELNNSSGAKRPVPGTVKIGGKLFRAGIHHAGKSTLDAVKKSYQLILSDGFYRGRSELRVSSQFSDPSLIRAQLGFQIFSESGVAASFIEPAALYLNGEFQGVYQLIEPVDLEFFTVRGLSIKELYKAKFGNAGFEREFLPKLKEAYSAKFEDANWTSLRYLWEQVNYDQVDLDAIANILDVSQYLRYIAASVALNHWDGFNNNYFLARSTVDGKFRIYPWDLDRIYEARPFTPEQLWGANKLTAVLLSNDRYREEYLRILAEVRSKVRELDLITTADNLSFSLQGAYAADVYLRNTFSMGEEVSALKLNIDQWLLALDSELKQYTSKKSGS